MKLFVGLGNVGAQYAQNRHNVGFMAVDAIADDRGFGPWRGKFQGSIAEGRLGAEKVLLLKPETLMNLSGDSVRAATQFYKLDPADVVVFHDELDLAPGKVRAKRGGGHAGHNGLRSIAAHIGPDFMRVRIGIGHPGDKRFVTRHVLSDFAKAELDGLEPLLKAISASADALADGDLQLFTSRMAQARAPAGASSRSVGKAEQTGHPAGDSEKASAHATPDPRNALQRLIDRFR